MLSEEQIDKKEQRHAEKWDRSAPRLRVDSFLVCSHTRVRAAKKEAKKAKGVRKDPKGSRKDLSAVTDNLFICDGHFARALDDKTHDFVLQLNCAPELHMPPREQPRLTVFKIRYRVTNPLEQLALFEEAAKVVSEAQGKVLVNCARGRSRSVAVVLFYLLKFEKMTLRQAYIKVKTARPFAGPSRWLQTQLDAIELHLLGQQSFTSNKKWADQVQL